MECFALCHWQVGRVGRVRRVGHFQALKCRGGSVRADCVSNTWLSAIALRILVGEGLWAVRIADDRFALRSACQSNSGLSSHPLRFALLTANFKKPLSHASYASHTSHLQSASRKHCALTSAFQATFKSRSTCTGARMRLHTANETAICRRPDSYFCGPGDGSFFGFFVELPQPPGHGKVK